MFVIKFIKGQEMISWFNEIMFITLINSNYVNKQSSKFIIIYVILIASIFKRWIDLCTYKRTVTDAKRIFYI